VSIRGIYEWKYTEIRGIYEWKYTQYFHITPFFARRGRNMVDLNPMAHGTENATQSVHHPIVDLRSSTLCLTRLQVVSLFAAD
jgi:hypothetical protein